MSHLSRTSVYGPEYEQLLLTTFANLPYTFPLKDPAQARAFQTKVYTYFRELRAENLRLDLIEMADSITLRVEGSSLVFMWKRDLWDAQVIREVLELAPDFAGGNGHDELKVPDLLATRLTKQLAMVRERRANAANIVPPFKTGK